MLLQGEHALSELLEFCERLETAETIYNSTHLDAASGKGKGSKNEDSNQKPPVKRQCAQKECPLHGKGNHSQGECRTLKEQGERI